MHTVKQKELLSGLVTLKKLKTHNSSLPILSNVVIYLKSDKVVMKCTDLDTTIFSVVAAEADGDHTSKVMVDVKQLHTVISKLKKFDTLDLTVEADDCLAVSTGKSKSRVTGTGDDFEDYPKDREKGDLVAELECEAIEDMKKIIKVSGYSGNDDLRPVMKSVNFKVSEGVVRICSTDAHMLATGDLMESEPGWDFNYNIPAAAFNFIKNEAGTINLYEGGATIIYESYIVHTKYEEGKYPNYEAVIPNENPVQFEFGKSEMLEAIDLCGITAPKKSNSAAIKMSSEECSLYSEDIDHGVNTEYKLEDSVMVGDEGLRIGANLKFLKQIVSDQPNDRFKVEASQPNRAMVIKSDLMYLIMPTMLTED